ncbi:MAG: shikimate kinase AroL [Desulfarculaceae bacterium]|nr:shikimate kinase AroL [Desulfarculaceae bacterium]
MKIFLIGYRGTGKTTTAKLLSELLGFSFIDTDQGIEERIGASIRELVEEKGWESFRTMEQSFLFGLEHTDNAVIATGGGIVLDPANRLFLRENGMVFRLCADMETLLSRIGADPGSDSSRPSLTGQEPEDEIRAVCEQREPFYSQTAHHQIDTTQQTPQQVALIIKRRIENGG